MRESERPSRSADFSCAGPDRRRRRLLLSRERARAHLYVRPKFALSKKLARFGIVISIIYQAQALIRNTAFLSFRSANLIFLFTTRCVVFFSLSKKVWRFSSASLMFEGFRSGRQQTATDYAHVRIILADLCLQTTWSSGFIISATCVPLAAILALMRVNSDV